MPRRKVILVTDGDQIAKDSLEKAAKNIGGRCISLSAGNPSPLTADSLVSFITQAAYDPILVMFDDCGSSKTGSGESNLYEVATHPDIEVLGALVVASNCMRSRGTPVHMSLDSYGNIVSTGVNKFGYHQRQRTARIYGDTVEILNKLSIPVIIGIGDIGKMRHRDTILIGSPVTTKAIQLILNIHYQNETK
ncbi:stage V sporulation protein AE [Shimazuella alba]|jgi:stage V sporulation protein AE|uniref:Stage V sporulation protein AE n=1 Tax=Shimazuella alba TaxID=2690964 RepID=A0A6I4VR00_9BACL|nr:stage V sporulation protein AE [Shimazuella alba]MXQ52190.1 stage V sporulation protein AE [Shimazuella alba]